MLDLLSGKDIVELLSEARRTLVVGGRLCLTSLTFGETVVSRMVSGLWRTLHAASPRLVGGCRPLRLRPFLGREWQVLHRQVVSTFALCTEVVVAARA